MDTMKGILKAILIACGLVVVPIFLVILGMALTVIGPVAGIVLIIGLPFIALGVVIGVRQKNGK